jgi:hypothetical protein
METAAKGAMPNKITYLKAIYEKDSFRSNAFLAQLQGFTAAPPRLSWKKNPIQICQTIKATCG